MHTLFLKNEEQAAKKITGQCCSTEMEFTCENSANLEQETKTTKIVTYPLFPLASSINNSATDQFNWLADCLMSSDVYLRRP